MKKNLKKPQINLIKGFTLIELLVVSTIIVIISAIGLVSFSSATKGARDAQRKSDLDNVRQALLLYRVDMGSYPAVSYNYGKDNVEEESLISAFFSQLNNSFQVEEVFAASIDPIYVEETPIPTLDPGEVRFTPTPTPTLDPGEVKLTPTPTPFPTSTPVFDTGMDVRSSNYKNIAQTLEDDGYFDGEFPLDPKDNSEYYYGYESDGTTFTLTATMEQEQSDGTFVYTLTN